MSAFKHSAVSFGTSDTPPPEAGRNIGPISLHNAIERGPRVQPLASSRPPKGRSRRNQPRLRLPNLSLLDLGSQIPSLFSPHETPLLVNGRLFPKHVRQKPSASWAYGAHC